jgi:hypothetical protein
MENILNFSNLMLLLVAGYMILHMIITTPVSSYTFSSVVRLVLIVFFFGMFLIGTIVATSEYKYRSKGIVTYAKPIDFKTKTETNFFDKQEFIVIYEFQDSNGIFVKNRANVTQFEWQLMKSVKDSTLKIIYIPGESYNNKLEGDDSYYKALMFVITGIIGMLSTLLKRMRFTHKALTYKEMAKSSTVRYRKPGEY